MAGLRRKWRRLRSGLYVPSLLRRLHEDERGAWFPGCKAAVVPDCTACKGGVHPTELTVTLADIANGGDCTTCTNANDDWTVPAFGSCTELPDAEDHQQYKDTFSVTICDDTSLVIIVNIWWNRSGTAGTREVEVNVYSLPAAPTDLYVVFRKTETGQSEPFDCQNFSSFDVPLVLDQGSTCDGSAATCALSA